MTFLITSHASSAKIGKMIRFPARPTSAAAIAPHCTAANANTGKTNTAGIASHAANRELCRSHSRTCPFFEIQNSKLRIEYRMDSAER